MTNGNGKTPVRWGKIREIPSEEIPSASVWWPLAQELLLRLEQTPENYALSVQFETADLAHRAAMSLTKIMRARKGAGAVVCLSSIDRDGCPALFVRRGTKWSE